VCFAIFSTKVPNSLKSRLYREMLDKTGVFLVVFLRYRGFGYAELNIGDVDLAKDLSCIHNYGLYYST